MPRSEEAGGEAGPAAGLQVTPMGDRDFLTVDTL